MVKGTVKIGELFTPVCNFNIDVSGNILKIVYFPTEDVQLIIAPTAETITKLKRIRDGILAVMDQEVELEGSVLERWEKQLVEEPAKTVVKWVQVK